MTHVDYSRLPQHMHDGVRRYITRGIRPGAFLTAVLENNLMAAFTRADDINLIYMRSWAEFLYNLPKNMWGSRAKVNAYVKEMKERANS